MSSPSICLIIPFFDEKKKMAWLRPKKFPTYFEYFIESYSHNKNVDLKILTNIPCSKYKRKYSNSTISFHRVSLKNTFELMQEELGINGYGFEQYRAYKICDLRPTFGEVFSEYLEGYDYWGYIDPDTVVGNLDKFFSKENISGYDMISGGRNNLTGYMTLYRNTKEMNQLYKTSPDYVKVINTPKGCRFDENGGDRNIVAMEQITRKNNIKINYLNCVHNDFGKVDDSTNNSKRDWIYDWTDGRLTDRLTSQEIAMFHLMKSKSNGKFTFPKIKYQSNFSISRQGLAYV